MRPDHILNFAIFLLILLIVLCQIGQPWRWFRSPEIIEAPKEKTERQLKPSSENDCSDCCIEKASPTPVTPKRLMPRLWSETKSPRGRTKEIVTQGYACNNRKCDYFHIMDASVHALVGNGCHGTYEKIQDLKCQVCKKKFSVRRDTVLYRLKTHSEKVAGALGCLAEGMDVSALERVTGIGEGTLRTWLARSGSHAEKLHAVFFQELIFSHIQLDELWASVRKEPNAVWVWVATDAITKIIPVVRLGPRTLDMAMAVVHDLRHMMQPDCTPVYTTDGLNLYFYAITAHHGNWVIPEGSTKPIWQVSAELLYGRVKKFLCRRRLVKVVRSMLCGELENLQSRLQDIGLSGRIQTSLYLLTPVRAGQEYQIDFE